MSPPNRDRPARWRFTLWQWKLVALFHAETRPLFVSPAAPAVPPSIALSPRLFEVQQHLLEGDGAKQIPRKLGLSLHTVKGYMKYLYRRHNVNSRGELMARFM